ncbi:MAG: type III-A CRISPR-associated protein Csm2 [bacterium]
MDKIIEEGQKQIKRCLQSGIDKEIHDYAERLGKYFRTASKIEHSPGSRIRLPLDHLRRLSQGMIPEADFNSELDLLKAEFIYAASQTETEEKGFQEFVSLINFGLDELLSEHKSFQGVRNLTWFLEAVLAYHYA